MRAGLEESAETELNRKIAKYAKNGLCTKLCRSGLVTEITAGHCAKYCGVESEIGAGDAS